MIDPGVKLSMTGYHGDPVNRTVQLIVQLSVGQILVPTVCFPSHIGMERCTLNVLRIVGTCVHISLANMRNHIVHQTVQLKTVNKP